MKNTILLFVLIFFTSCQSQLTSSEHLVADEVPVKLASAATPILTSKGDVSWYSEINELENFRGFEEENGILLGKKYSVGTYTHPDEPQTKWLVLEKIQHQDNGEAKFQKLDVLKIELERLQFLTNDFCQLENNDEATILAIYESDGEIAYSKNFIKAWQVNLQTFKLESISPKGVKCLEKW